MTDGRSPASQHGDAIGYGVGIALVAPQRGLLLVACQRLPALQPGRLLEARQERHPQPPAEVGTVFGRVAWSVPTSGAGRSHDRRCSLPPYNGARYASMPSAVKPTR